MYDSKNREVRASNSLKSSGRKKWWFATCRTYSSLVALLFSIASNISSTVSKWTKHQGLLSVSVIVFETSSGFLNTLSHINERINFVFTGKNFCVLRSVQQYYQARTMVDQFQTSFYIFYLTWSPPIDRRSIHFVHLLCLDILSQTLEIFLYFSLRLYLRTRRKYEKRCSHFFSLSGLKPKYLLCFTSKPNCLLNTVDEIMLAPYWAMRIQCFSSLYMRKRNNCICVFYSVILFIIGVTCFIKFIISIWRW